MTPENQIDHIALVIDASSSMSHLRRDVIKVVDAEIEYLARRSRDLNREVRVSVYVFASDVRCVIFDKDVLRLPSIADFYRNGGMTALVDATLLSLDDLDKTAQMYGDHAFLVYALTDGEENASRSGGPARLAQRIAGLPDNWTLGAFVPDQRGVFAAKQFGFPAANIAVWSTTTQGVTEVGETMRRATDAYMTGRASGIRGSRTLFSMGTDSLNATAVQQAGLNKLPSTRFRLFPVLSDGPIREFVESHGLTYTTGAGYYPLTKPEMVQANKAVAVRDRRSGAVYTGSNARTLLGLPAADIRVKPDHNPDYEVYVQSTSVNRKLIGGTTLLLLV